VSENVKLRRRDVIAASRAFETLAQRAKEDDCDQQYQVRVLARRLRGLFDAHEDAAALEGVLLRKYALQRGGKYITDERGGLQLDAGKGEQHAAEHRAMMLEQVEVTMERLLTPADFDRLGVMPGIIMAQLEPFIAAAPDGVPDGAT